MAGDPLRTHCSTVYDCWDHTPNFLKHPKFYITRQCFAQNVSIALQYTGTGEAASAVRVPGKNEKRGDKHPANW